jgi:hypothetical protein
VACEPWVSRASCATATSYVNRSLVNAFELGVEIASRSRPGGRSRRSRGALGTLGRPLRVGAERVR